MHTPHAIPKVNRRTVFEAVFSRQRAFQSEPTLATIKPIDSNILQRPLPDTLIQIMRRTMYLLLPLSTQQYSQVHPLGS